MRKTRFITGTTRGFGVEIAKAALRAGDRGVATGRKLASVAASVGRDSDQLLCLELDVCDPEKPRAAVCAAVPAIPAARIDLDSMVVREGLEPSTSAL